MQKITSTSSEKENCLCTCFHRWRCRSIAKSFSISQIYLKKKNSKIQMITWLNLNIWKSWYVRCIWDVSVYFELAFLRSPKQSFNWWNFYIDVKIHYLAPDEKWLLTGHIWEFEWTLEVQEMIKSIFHYFLYRNFALHDIFSRENKVEDVKILKMRFTNCELMENCLIEWNSVQLTSSPAG